jgi:hypothetical protein
MHVHVSACTGTAAGIALASYRCCCKHSVRTGNSCRRRNIWHALQVVVVVVVVVVVILIPAVTFKCTRGVVVQSCMPDVVVTTCILASCAGACST